MSLLLDTSAVIRLFELARPDVIDLVAADDGRFAVSLVTLAELHRGAARAQTPAIARLRSETIAMAQRRGEVLVPTEEVAHTWGSLAARVPRRVGANDLWIAAAALVSGRTLVSADAELIAVLEGHPTARIES